MPMKKLSRTEALDDIATWQCSDVVFLFQKHGVEEECWRAAEKRQIDGDELLHLTEGKLALWKSDLTRPLIWNLWKFVEEVKKFPEKYVEERQSYLVEASQSNKGHNHRESLSYNASSGIDLEYPLAIIDDHITNCLCGATKASINRNDNPNFRNSLKLFQESDKLETDVTESNTPERRKVNKQDEIRANFKIVEFSGSTYVNVDSDISSSTSITTDVANSTNTERLSKNSSHLHSKHNPDGQIKEKLELNEILSIKSTASRKSENSSKHTNSRRRDSRASFLHKINNCSDEQIVHNKKNLQMLQDKALSSNDYSRSNYYNSLNYLPKPPLNIRSFDLVANLPTHSPGESEEEEEEDYEAFDERFVERRTSIISDSSGHSLRSPGQNSVESINKLSSNASCQNDEEVYEIYESITESLDDLIQGKDIENCKAPPPLPIKCPPITITKHNIHNKIDSKTERSLDSKSTSLPHTGSNTSLISTCSNGNNATRPLPQPPSDKLFYHDRPWFHNISREHANLLIEEKCAHGNQPDGYFLMRPSTSNPNNPLTLVLWCKDRVYNVPVRKRPDNRYALGSSKSDEHSFASIDEMVTFYKKEKLFLYTGGVQTGSTRLTDSLPK